MYKYELLEISHSIWRLDLFESIFFLAPNSILIICYSTGVLRHFPHEICMQSIERVVLRFRLITHGSVKNVLTLTKTRRIWSAISTTVVRNSQGWNVRDVERLTSTTEGSNDISSTAVRTSNPSCVRSVIKLINTNVDLDDIRGSVLSSRLLAFSRLKVFPLTLQLKFHPL